MSLQLEKHIGLITTGRNCPCSVLSMKEDGVTLVPFAGSAPVPASYILVFP